MVKRKVLVIGAAGYVANQILDHFKDRYDLLLCDTTKTNGNGKVIDGIKIVDLLNSDEKQYQNLFSNIDTVVHLGLIHSKGKAIDKFESENNNIRMNYNVFKASFEAGVKRVIYASSNHAADWYENFLIHDRKMDNIDPYLLPLSDNFYGWAKASSEHMGFLFACGTFGRKMDIVNVRIGSPKEINPNEKDVRLLKRHLGSYLSPRDLSQLLVSSIETINIENEHGIPWQIVYGISNNTRSFWSLVNARKIFGYSPIDDAEIKFSDQVSSKIGKNIGKLGKS